MKKLLLGSVVLCLFAMSITLVQISCSKSEASPTGPSQVGKIVYETGLQIWTANYDGTNANPISVTLPTDISFNFGTVSSSLTTSPDGQTIFFTCTNSTYPFVTTELYSCSINGGNATLVIPIPPGTSATQHVGHVHTF